jgi:hypothetical protein
MDLQDKELCKVASKKVLKHQLDDYIQLVSEPQFVCIRCGRVARSRKNLCKPKKMS